MNNLQHRQTKIQEKRKQTHWRDFVKEIASWFPFMLHKNNGTISAYSKDTDRVGSIVSCNEYEDLRVNLPTIEYTGHFFEDMKKGFKETPLAGQKVVGANENSDFNYIILGAKDCYLSIVVVDSSSIVYSYNAFRCDNVFESVLVENSSNIYHSRCISNSSKIFGSSNIQDSADIWFSANLLGCKFCIGCDGLQHKEYYVNNEYVGEKIYLENLKILLQSDNKGEAFQSYYHEVLRNPGLNTGERVSGSLNRRGMNIDRGLMTYQLKDGKNVVFCNATDVLENAVDCCSIGGAKSSHIYACMGVGYNCEHVYCSVECSPGCHNIYYSYLLDSCSYCLGCIGLKNKTFCIFNKQYTKEERHQKVDEIFTQMEQDGDLGKFFPASMNPFYFNDTAAALIEDFDRDEIVAEGYLRRDEEIAVDIPDWMDVVKVDELGQYESRVDGVWSIDPSILKKVIKDEKGNVYRVIKMEYDFLVKHGLPLPRKHWLERLKGHFRIK